MERAGHTAVRAYGMLEIAGMPEPEYRISTFIAFWQCEAGNNLIFPRKTCGKPVPHVFSLARG